MAGADRNKGGSKLGSPDPDNPDDYMAGFPAHPHRGFETVTYMLDGRLTA